MSRLAKRCPIAARLWAKIKKSGPDDCWPWIAGKNRAGYGTIQSGTRPLLAHRVAYELTRGPIPDGLNVLHRCDNPACCNPAHLWIGTPIDNIADMNAKGRNGNIGRKMRPESIAKRRLTCAANDSHQKRWTTRRANNPNWLEQCLQAAAMARTAKRNRKNGGTNA